MLIRPALTAGLLGLLLTTGAPQPQPDLLLRGVTLVDLEAERLEANRTLVIAGGRIVVIGGPDAEAPAGATVVDASGLYAMPGLVDAHAHLSYWGEDALGRLVGHGVTTVREMGGDPDEIDGWKRAVEAGELVGPRIFWCGPFFEGPGGEERYRWTVGSPEEARAAAERLLARGVDFLKIQPRIAPAEVAALVTAATAAGSSVVGHVPDGLSAIEAAELGLRSLEHISPYLRLSETELAATIEVLLEREVWVSPALYSTVAQIEAGGEDPAAHPTVQRAREVIRRFHEAGVPMLVGANFAFREWPHAPGRALHGEMRTFAEAGVPWPEVLRMTTFGNARFLGIAPEETRVAAGARADLLLLGNNPLEGASSLERIARVVLDGRYLAGERLAQLRSPR